MPLHPALVHLPLGLAVILPLIAAGFGWAFWTGRVRLRAWVVDMTSDASTGADRMHLAGEAMVMVASFGGVAVLWRGWRAAEALAGRLDRDLDRARQEAEKFRADAREALQGLGEAIDAQFARWHLTPAEQEVGLLLLKGLSHREAAEVRQTSEATVRQQALALYRKAGLRSRSDLSAFFLEDLLLPRS